MIDFGDWVTGSVLVDDGSLNRLVQPQQIVTGMVVGLLPHLPKVAIVRVSGGKEFHVRVAKIVEKGS